MPFTKIRQTEQFKQLEQQFDFLDHLIDAILDDDKKEGGTHSLSNIKIEVKDKAKMPPIRPAMSGGIDFSETDYNYNDITVRTYSAIPSHGSGETKTMSIVIYR